METDEAFQACAKIAQMPTAKIDCACLATQLLCNRVLFLISQYISYGIVELLKITIDFTCSLFVILT